MGRKAASKTNVTKAATAMRSASKMSAEKQDINRATDRLEIEQQKYRDLEEQFEKELETLEQNVSPEQLTVEEYSVRPRKSDITVAEVSLVWLPFSLGKKGDLTPLYDLETK